MSARTIDPVDVRAMLDDGAEIALLDVREQGAHSLGHPLLAVCAAFSRLELRAAFMLPRRDLRIVVLDGGDDDDALARAAASLLTSLGYSNVSIMRGGATAWQAAGLELFSGVNVPSKAFGEVIEHRHDTPRVTADELAAMLEGDSPMVVLDSRPQDEFERVSIPGGIDCPGAELVYRVHEMAPDPETLVVVNCAGRTRSIIGAQSLINAGLPNRVVALKDGTMGWQLAGHEPASGCRDHAPAPGPQALAVASERAAAVAQRFGIERIDAETVAAWQADSTATTFILDIRTADEYREGHWPGARHAPGGQLVQATDEYVFVRGARLVLADSADGVRATMTAHWLRQMGWPTVRVLTDEPPSPETGDGPSAPWPDGVDTLSAQELRASEPAPLTIELRSSKGFLRGHLPGSYWTVRARLAESTRALRESGATQHGVVFVGSDDTLAAYAARDWQDAGYGRARVLAGGFAAWRETGGEISTGEPERLLTEADDAWLKPYERLGEGTRAMQEYLTWEVGLVEQLERDGSLRFWHPAG